MEVLPPARIPANEVAVRSRAAVAPSAPAGKPARATDGSSFMTSKVLAPNSRAWFLAAAAFIPASNLLAQSSAQRVAQAITLPDVQVTAPRFADTMPASMIS